MWPRGWEAAFKEHVKDTGCEVADITMANCLRRLVPPDLSADFQKMSHIVRYGDVKRYIIDQVGLRAQRVTQIVSNQWTRASLSSTMTIETGETFGNDESIFMP